MSTPCIEMLFTQLPTARLCLIAPKSILELFSADSRIYACFEDSTKQAKNRLKATWQLGRAIRARLECDGGIDIGITLTNHFYSALLLFAAGARVRVGYKRGLGNVFLTHKLGRVGGIHQVESYVWLIDLTLGEQGRVGFLAKNGDCCGESALITTQGKSLDSPCKAPFLAQKSCREDMEPESQNGVTRQAENKIGECEKSPFSSLRADNGGAAIHNKKTQPLESTFENNANKTHKVTPIFAAAKNMDCHAVQAVLAMTENNAAGEKVDSRKNAQSVFDNHAAGGRISLKEHQQCQSDSSPQAESPKQNEDFGENTTHIPPLKLHTKPLDSSKSRKHLCIGLNPGAAYGSAKCWDKEHYACVGAYFAAMGAEVVIYGVEADRQLAEEIIKEIDFILGDSALRDKSWISSPLDRHLSLISLRGLKTSEAVQGEAEAGFFSKNPTFSSQSVASLENKQSEVSLEKPTPQTKKAQSTSAKPTPKTPKIINACGQTTIPTLLQDLQALDLFITNDSGSMHIAAALGVPMVAIFGPTNMRETAPWRARDCALLNLNLPCAPCKKRVCPLGHHKCMKDLRPEMVIEAALAILHKPKLSK